MRKETEKKVKYLIDLINCDMREPTAYSNPEDSVGYHACCGTYGLKPHSENCWYRQIKEKASEIDTDLKS